MAQPIKNKFFSISMLMISLLLASKAARAQGQIELMCRNKAKEAALQTYQGCVTEEKTTRLKDIKERYKSRMSEVKEEFQRELDEINGRKAQAASAEETPSPKVTKKTPIKPRSPNARTRPGRAEKPVSGMAKSLPTKQNDNGPALSVQTESEETAVIAAGPISEETSSGMPEPEIVDVSDQ